MILFLSLLPALAALAWIGYRWRVVTRESGDNTIGYYIVYVIVCVGVLMYALGAIVTYCIGLMYA